MLGKRRNRGKPELISDTNLDIFLVYYTEDLEVPELHAWRYIKASIVNSVIFFFSLIGMQWCLTETENLSSKDMF